MEEVSFGSTLFVDAALSKNTERIGLGVAIISSNNKTQATLSKPLEGILSVLHAEALALVAGLQWAQTTGLTLRKVLTDSQSLVQALNSETEYHNELGLLIDDARELMQFFPGMTWSHVSRILNVQAHNLARQALQLEDEISWLEDGSSE